MKKNTTSELQPERPWFQWSLGRLKRRLRSPVLVRLVLPWDHLVLDLGELFLQRQHLPLRLVVPQPQANHLPPVGVVHSILQYTRMSLQSRLLE